MTTRWLLRMCVVAALLLSGPAALAFPNVQWMENAATSHRDDGTGRAGGGGLYGTGGKGDFGVKCSHCHIEGEGKIDMQLTANPPWQMVNGVEAYKPGQVYDITIELLNEHKHAADGRDNNGFAAAIEDSSGALAGELRDGLGGSTNNCPNAIPANNGKGQQAPSSPNQTSILFSPDNSSNTRCHAIMSVTHAKMQNALTKWSFQWVAPPAGAGELTIFVGVVDGDTDGGNSLHDDTVERAIPLAEGS